MAAGGEDLRDADHDFKADQKHDDDLEPQRAAGVDDVGERIGGLGDHRELAVERLDPLRQFVFVLQPGLEPLQIRTIPQRVGLLGDRNATGDVVLHEQRLPDQLEDAAPVAVKFS